jgi:hypothetical protein
MDAVITDEMLIDFTNSNRQTVPIGPRPASAPLDLIGSRSGRATGGAADRLIGQTLTWLAEQFGTRSARLLRPLASGGWLVTTHRRNGMLTYQADEFEVAMAWMVALGRLPLTVTRPRVTQRDGTGVRPISAKTYLGLPLICQDDLVGVIELAGELQQDPDQMMQQAQARLSSLACRLVHDPELDDAEPELSLTMRVSLGGGIWCLGDVVLTTDDVRFLSVVQSLTILDDVREQSGLGAEVTLEIARALLRRGLIELQPR